MNIHLGQFYHPSGSLFGGVERNKTRQAAGAYGHNTSDNRLTLGPRLVLHRYLHSCSILSQLYGVRRTSSHNWLTHQIVARVFDQPNLADSPSYTASRFNLFLANERKTRSTCNYTQEPSNCLSNYPFVNILFTEFYIAITKNIFYDTFRKDSHSKNTTGNTKSDSKWRHEARQWLIALGYEDWRHCGNHRPHNLYFCRS